MTTDPDKADTTWMRYGACLGSDPDLFFPERGDNRRQIAVAKRVCATCVVRQACLNYAITEHLTDGIFGGTTPKERKGIRARRRAS